MHPCRRRGISSALAGAAGFERWLRRQFSGAVFGELGRRFEGRPKAPAIFCCFFNMCARNPLVSLCMSERGVSCLLCGGLTWFNVVAVYSCGCACDYCWQAVAMAPLEGPLHCSLVLGMGPG